MSVPQDSADSVDVAMACACGLSMSRNPHPDAGDPGLLGVEVGHVWVCIPCTVRTRSRWSKRAMRAETALSRLVELKDGPRDSRYLTEKPKAWAAARAALRGGSAEDAYNDGTSE